MSEGPLDLPPPLAPPPLWQRVAGLRRRMSWKQAFTALKYPNYRLWFWSQMFSMFGTWMESTALGFLVYDLTKSPAYLGLVGFAAGVPTWLFMLYASCSTPGPSPTACRAGTSSSSPRRP
ncbi:MAG: MFS transporter [Acidobacteria bacterium]|nr:MFS transporter [Acidobacteriota bacterium]